MFERLLDQSIKNNNPLKKNKRELLNIHGRHIPIVLKDNVN